MSPLGHCYKIIIYRNLRDFYTRCITIKKFYCTKMTFINLLKCETVSKFIVGNWKIIEIRQNVMGSQFKFL